MFSIAIFEILELIIAIGFLYAIYRFLKIIFKGEKKLFDKMEKKDNEN